MINCIYFHINLFKQEVFYVGIGKTEKRPYSKGNRSKWWHNIINKYGYTVVVIHDNLTWEEACVMEIKYIAQLGRADKGMGTLVNLTDGGEGSNGLIMSDEAKRKLSESHKGKITWMRGKKHSKETKDKLRNISMGRSALLR